LDASLFAEDEEEEKQQVLISEEFKLGFKDLGSGFRVQRRPEPC